MTVQNGVGRRGGGRGRPGPRRSSPGRSRRPWSPRTGGVRRAAHRRDGRRRGPGRRRRPRAARWRGASAGAWTAAGLPARVYDDAAAMKWSKLLANLVGNATSAILDMDPGRRLRGPARLSRSSGASSARRSRSCGRSASGPSTLPGADVSLLLRGLALPEAVGRPIVARAIAGRAAASRRRCGSTSGAAAAGTRPDRGALAQRRASRPAGARPACRRRSTPCLAALVDEVRGRGPGRVVRRVSDRLARTAWPGRPSRPGPGRRP